MQPHPIKAKDEQQAPPQVKKSSYNESSGAAHGRAEVFESEAIKLSIFMFVRFNRAWTDMPYMKWYTGGSKTFPHESNTFRARCAKGKAKTATNAKYPKGIRFR